MDQTVIGLLNDRIEDLKDDVTEIKADVKSLLNFKWQIVGGSVVGSVIFSVLVTVIIQFFVK